ncbi:PAS domain-containing protein [Salinarchaeum sp. IM2453]|uniref:hybrid sensor histidine kinase/response regulator n=1 Tax=Salinarchaeum sp. IM2453 TaxID=2862870 RepID=UPI001C83ADF3|nr:response regulator [Salinarchaeum sp. IM2453]QZA88528.1 PAS domain-containing protein [Salinarchaeum sp. IM2453]
MAEPITVLHVDDDPKFVDMVAAFLEKEHDEFNVITATSARGGINRLGDQDVDCIVSDYEMPRQSGIELLTQVREDHPELPFILFTGKGSEEIASKAISAGVTEYLQKETGTGQYTVLANRIQNVVEQYRSQQAAREAEEKLIQLAEQTDDVLFIVSNDFSEFEFINSAYTDLWGESVTNIQNDPTQVLESIVPEDREAVSQAMDRAADGHPQTIECQLARPDGENRWVQAKAEPVLDDDGDVVRIAGIIRDITDQKQREQTLKELQERLELAIDGANLGIWDWNIQTDSVTFNDNWATMLGYDPDDIGSHLNEWERRVHPDDLDAVQAALDDHIANHTEYYDTEHRMRTADGDWKWIRDVGKIFERDEDGTPMRAVGIHIDIDDRKQAEIHLREERDMFAQGPVVVLKWQDTEDWPVEYVSENVTEVFGYSPEEIMADDFRFADIIHEDDLDRVTAQVEANRDPEVDYFKHQPYRVISKGGECVWVLDYTKNISNDNGEITHQLGYVTDITEQKRREQKLKQQNERLDKFASTLSHDIRCPLNVASGRLNLATEECDSEHLDDAIDALSRIEELIDDLLTLARQGDEIGDTELVQVDSLARLSWQNIEAAEATLDINTETTICADQSRLQQAVENLLRNAVEHSREPVHITVGDTENGFYIADGGPGIPEERRDKIFEPGYSPEETGSGFGLAIVKDIVEAHDWNITVTESDQGGARFAITGADVINCQKNRSV